MNLVDKFPTTQKKKKGKVFINFTDLQDLQINTGASSFALWENTSWTHRAHIQSDEFYV